MSDGKVEVGVISDTHGLLRPEALAALEGCDLVVHAGDVGSDDVLAELERRHALRVVRGNVDRGGRIGALPLTETFEVGGVTIHMIHILEDLDLDPAAAGIDLVVFGHTHVPETTRREGILYLNPGSAGPKRFDRPVTLARLTLGEGEPRVRTVELLDR